MQVVRLRTDTCNDRPGPLTRRSVAGEQSLVVEGQKSFSFPCMTVSFVATFAAFDTTVPGHPHLALTDVLPLTLREMVEALVALDPQGINEGNPGVPKATATHNNYGRYSFSRRREGGSRQIPGGANSRPVPD